MTQGSGRLSDLPKFAQFNSAKANILLTNSLITTLDDKGWIICKNGRLSSYLAAHSEEWLVPTFLCLFEGLGYHRQEHMPCGQRGGLFVDAHLQWGLNRKSYQNKYLNPDIFDNNLCSQPISILICLTGKTMI